MYNLIYKVIIICLLNSCSCIKKVKKKDISDIVRYFVLFIFFRKTISFLYIYIYTYFNCLYILFLYKIDRIEDFYVCYSRNSDLITLSVHKLFDKLIME